MASSNIMWSRHPPWRRFLMVSLHLFKPLTSNLGVALKGLQPDLAGWSSARHSVNLIYASAVPRGNMWVKQTDRRGPEVKIFSRSHAEVGAAGAVEVFCDVFIYSGSFWSAVMRRPRSSRYILAVPLSFFCLRS